MKKITNKVFLLGIIISIFLAAISIPSFAKTETKTIVLKKSDDKYLIYFDEICNNAFKFALQKITIQKIRLILHILMKQIIALIMMKYIYGLKIIWII